MILGNGFPFSGITRGKVTMTISGNGSTVFHHRLNFIARSFPESRTHNIIASRAFKTSCANLVSQVSPNKHLVLRLRAHHKAVLFVVVSTSSHKRRNEQIQQHGLGTKSRLINVQRSQGVTSCQVTPAVQDAIRISKAVTVFWASLTASCNRSRRRCQVQM